MSAFKCRLEDGRDCSLQDWTVRDGTTLDNEQTKKLPFKAKTKKNEKVSTVFQLINPKDCVCRFYRVSFFDFVELISNLASSSAEFDKQFFFAYIQFAVLNEFDFNLFERKKLWLIDWLVRNRTDWQ